MDSWTKYNLGSRLVWSRTLEEFDEFFRGLKELIGAKIHQIFRGERRKPPRERRLVTFVTDELDQYKRAFNRYFYRIAKLEFGVPIACRQYGFKHNNNPIERHNGDIKQRYKVMWHFKSFDSAEAFLNLRRAVYNHVRTHQGLKRTPAEAAEIELGLGRNRLVNLIRSCSALP